MIRTENISFKIDEKYLVRDITVNFAPQKITFISGPNGAGKSTLVHLISGVYKPTTGDIWMGESLLEKISQKRRAQITGVLSQNVSLTFPLSVRDVVVMGRYPHSTGQLTTFDLEICEEVMHFFNVISFADRNYLSLSGGEKQRVQFARVAVQIWPDENNSGQNKCLLLDEPLTHLDIHYQLQFLHLLRQMMQKQPLTVIGVIHDLNLAVRYADEAVLMNNGVVVAAGEASQVYSHQNIESVFSVTPKTVTDEDGNKGFLF